MAIAASSRRTREMHMHKRQLHVQWFVHFAQVTARCEPSNGKRVWSLLTDRFRVSMPAIDGSRNLLKLILDRPQSHRRLTVGLRTVSESQFRREQPIKWIGASAHEVRALMLRLIRDHLLALFKQLLHVLDLIFN